MTNTKMVIPNQEVQQTAIELLKSLQADNYPIKPEILQLINSLAMGKPMLTKKGKK
jgi:hypothetical protein